MSALYYRGIKISPAAFDWPEWTALYVPSGGLVCARIGDPIQDRGGLLKFLDDVLTPDGSGECVVPRDLFDRLADERREVLRLSVDAPAGGA